MEELQAYHRAERAYQYEQGTPIRGIRWRRVIHPLLLAVLAIGRRLDKEHLHVLNDRRRDTAKPVIYACTHVGWKDIEMNFASIKKHAYLFWGDPRGLYREIEGALLYLNGMICMDSDQKEDRFIGKETCVRLLEAGGSLLIFPEGAWNVLVDQVVMPLFTGTAEMAIRSGAEIIPLATEQYGHDYYVNIGENISVDGYDLSQKRELTDMLRDTLCTLKWEIWEQHGVEKRADIPSDYLTTFLAQYEEQMDEVYTIDDVHATRFRPKVTSLEEAFAHLQTLSPCRENAFLFNKRYYHA